MTELFVNARIVNRGKIARGWVLVKDEFIERTAEGDAPEDIVADKLTDLGGAYLMPGVIDTHVHFRDGGNGGSPKGDIASESAAALAGGVTSIFDMPNTSPAAISLENINLKAARAAELSKVNYAFFLGATNTNLPELKAADYTVIPGVKLFMGASTGNMLVDSRPAIRSIFSEVDAIKAVHAENQEILDRNMAALKERYAGAEGGIPISEHPVWRNEQACLSSTINAIELARETGSRLHICHISTAAEARIFTPGNVADKKITAETCPQYLIFAGQDDYKKYGARIKCNPAIKGEDDRAELISALIDGRIDSIATDHAPHLPADKEGDLTRAASGMPGIQFSLILMLELARRTPGLSIERIVELMAHNPATIFSIDRRGFIEPGMYADLVAVEETEPYIISDSDVISTCGWTPYAGQKVSFRIKTTRVNGTTSAPAQIRFRQ